MCISHFWVWYNYFYVLASNCAKQVRLNMGRPADLHPNSGCYNKVVISGLHIVALFYALYMLQDLGRAVCLKTV